MNFKTLKFFTFYFVFRPESGDIIAALLPDTDIWSRALVLSEPTNLKSSYRVAMFDLGCVHDVKEIAPLNKYYRDLSNLSVYCEIKQFPDRRKPLKLFKVWKSFSNECMYAYSNLEN